MVRAIIFDLGGVIVPLDFPRAYAAIEKLCPYEAPEIQRRIMSADLMMDFEKGLVAPEEFAHRMSRELELNITFPQFCELWSTIFPPSTLVPESLLAKLGRNHRLLLLSNTNAIHFPYIERHYPILERFDDFVLSFRLGLIKPAAEIYRKAVERAGCEAGECLFIDDVEENVEGAKRAGLQAVRFESLEQLEEDLARLECWKQSDQPPAPEPGGQCG